uniref:Uncharacterized protein n=1 Tax=Pithovirus LCPAC406 TaxID=2506599 RepID=A0A481ZDR3_9VIRU|nr:MAG: hypothetical protein LCPAC406_01100 [Pithovirus LCPAC406]
MLHADVLTEVYLFLSVKDVTILLRVSNLFNIRCESMWKRLVKNEFGITKLFGSTWKDAAILLSQCNMINMNKRWIDGRTYNDIFTDSLNNINYFDIVRYDYHIASIFRPPVIIDEKTAKEYVTKHYRKTNLDISRFYYDDGVLYNHLRFMTRELYILTHAHHHFVSNNRIHGISTLLCSKSPNILHYDGPDLFMPDPISYIMCYSLIPYSNLCITPFKKRVNNISRRIIRTSQNDSYWKNIMRNNYGITKMYGSSWKETYYFFARTNMINLNKKWIDGRTYYEILNAGNIYRGQIYVFPDDVNDQKSAYKFVEDTYDLKYFQTKYGIDVTDEIAIKYHLRAITREFVVVNLTIIDMGRGMHNFNYMRTPKERKILNRIKVAFVDPILLVASYSMYDNKHLSGIIR